MQRDFDGFDDMAWDSGYQDLVDFEDGRRLPSSPTANCPVTNSFAAFVFGCVPELPTLPNSYNFIEPLNDEVESPLENQPDVATRTAIDVGSAPDARDNIPGSGELALVKSRYRVKIF